MKRLGLTMFAIMMALIPALAQKNIQWRGENRTGVYDESGLMKQWPADGLKMLWHYDQLGEGYSSVAIANDKIYVNGMKDGQQGWLTVLDLNGNMLRQVNYGQEWKGNYSGARGAVTVNDGLIFIESGFGVLYCLIEGTLETLWKKDLVNELGGEMIKFAMNEVPLIIDNKVIATVGGKLHNIVALNKLTGELIWSTPANGDIAAYCSPIFVDDVNIPQIITFTAHSVVGVNPVNGTMLWSYPWSDRWDTHANSPLYSDGMIMCTSGNSTGSLMLRLDKSGTNVTKVWENKSIENGYSGIVKYGNEVYGYNESRHQFACLDWNTGNQLWTGRIAQAVPILADDMMYLYTGTGEVLLVKPDKTKLDIVSRQKITLGEEQHWAHPVIYKGVLYVRHGYSLMAFDIEQ